ncbi:unnamed protein product, partial [Discosporangium mesarthrocarpum]
DQVSCGADFTCAIDERGRLFTFGQPEHGQLGNGTTGEFIERAGKVSFDNVLVPTLIGVFVVKDAKNKLVEELKSVKLVDIQCGRNHTVAVESPPLCRVFTWGFGGYGRLGHASQEMELRPRLVDTLARLKHVKVKTVSAGASCSMALSTSGHLFYWGKLPNAPRGEATMYPRIVDDLSNWQVRSATASNAGVLVASETSTIAWGSSVAGELGFGEDDSRTSSKPKKLDALEGVTVTSVTMGFAHSLMLARQAIS